MATVFSMMAKKLWQKNSPGKKFSMDGDFFCHCREKTGHMAIIFSMRRPVHGDEN